ncbi:hypothetical protein NGUA04_02525 [Salmonella enterica]|nr:hypothetical protein NGUA04_02525 [Salmonella enterica]
MGNEGEQGLRWGKLWEWNGEGKEIVRVNGNLQFFFQAEDGMRDIKRLLLSPGNTSISPENIAGQSLSVGFRPLPQTTPSWPTSPASRRQKSKNRNISKIA